MAAAGESHLAGNAIDRQPANLQQLGCATKPDVTHVVHGSAPEALLKVAGECQTAHVGDVCQRFERMVLVRIIEDGFDDMRQALILDRRQPSEQHMPENGIFMMVGTAGIPVKNACFPCTWFTGNGPG